MRRIFAICLSICVAACDVQVNTAHRSGTVENDNIAEAPPAEYRIWLKSTNNVLQAFSTGQYAFIEKHYVDNEKAPGLTAEKLEQLATYIAEHAGELRSYKEGQWGFVPENKDGISLVHSVKIVEHEEMPMHYIFTYLEDRPEKIVGITIKERKGVRAPNEI